MEQQDPDQQSRLDPRAVPVAVASVLVIVLGIFSTYANTRFGALIVLLGLGGLVWVGRMATRQPPGDA